MRECSINPQVDVKHFGADGEAVESLCSEQESTEQVVFSIKQCGSMTFTSEVLPRANEFLDKLVTN